MKDLSQEDRVKLLLRMVEFSAKQVAASFKRAVCAKHGCNSCLILASGLADRFGTVLANELGIERTTFEIVIPQGAPDPSPPKESMN